MSCHVRFSLFPRTNVNAFPLQDFFKYTRRRSSVQSSMSRNQSTFRSNIKIDNQGRKISSQYIKRLPISNKSLQGCLPYYIKPFHACYSFIVRIYGTVKKRYAKNRKSELSFIHVGRGPSQSRAVHNR